MSFWNLSDNTTANTNASTEFEIPAGGFEVIPAGSSVLAIIDQAQWTRKDRNDLSSPEYLELRWQIMQPEAVKGRKVFHKLWVSDPDPNAKDATKAQQKKDKALRMLAAIDANAGGKLSTLSTKPTDNQLGVALTNKPMVITLQVWEDQNKQPAGNWVSAVAPKTKALELKTAKPSASSASSNSGGWGSGWDTPASSTSNANSLDDDLIPF